MSEFLQELTSSWLASLPSFEALIFHLLLSYVLSQPLAWIYVRTHQGLSYSRTFVQSLVLMSFIVTFVLLAIGDSLARAFGLFGALALIRFRTPIKDTRDTVFLFLSVAIGIGVGTHNVLLAILGTALALTIILVLHWTRFGDVRRADGVLRFRLAVETDTTEALEHLLDAHCRHYTLMQVREAMNEGELEYAYELELRRQSRAAELVSGLRTRFKAGDVSLLMQTDHEEV